MFFAGDGHIQFTDYESYRASIERIFKDIQCFTEVKRSKTCIYLLAEDAATCTVEFKSKFLTVKGDTIVHTDDGHLFLKNSMMDGKLYRKMELI